jgi:dipeptidyl aminopeptidase/acylaminoacyl peptidase
MHSGGAYENLPDAILAARQGVDSRRIAFVGHSFGAMMGAVAAADKRFKIGLAN